MSWFIIQGSLRVVQYDVDAMLFFWKGHNGSGVSYVAEKTLAGRCVTASEP